MLDEKIYKEFYENFIGFDDYIEVRIFKKNNTGVGRKNSLPFSLYAKNFNELKTIFESYSNDDYNIYFGINTRKNKGRKDADIEFRKIFYIDIESTGEKPLYTDEIYIDKLNKTTKYLIDKIKEKYGLNHGAIVLTGRGYHLYYKIENINAADTKLQFRNWFKSLESELEDDIKMKIEEGKLYKDIKFTDSVFNVSRIASAPGTINQKYDEKPLRNIVYLDISQVNNIGYLLDKYEKVYSKSNKVHKELLFTDESIYKTAEFKILKRFDDLPEGKIHSNILFAFKLLVRDSGLTDRENLDKIERNLFSLGYGSEDMSPPSEDYQYSQRILINWCIENFYWCVKVKYKIPYKINAVKHNYRESGKMVDFRKERIMTYRELIKYIREFNDYTMIQKNTHQVMSIESLKTNVLKNIDPTLLKFIEMNDLWDRIKLSKTIKKK